MSKNIEEIIKAAEMVEAVEIIEKGTVPIKTIKQVAAVIGACGVIIGAILTVDNRYAKPADIEHATLTLQESIDELHKDLLENEQLRLELGNDVKSTKILLDKNKQELIDVKQRLMGQRLELSHRTMSVESAAIREVRSETPPEISPIFVMPAASPVEPHEVQLVPEKETVETTVGK
jgi:hypothetical protein